MVSNMLVVLCSEHPTQPIVNTGTLYQMRPLQMLVGPPNNG